MRSARPPGGMPDEAEWEARLNGILWGDDHHGAQRWPAADHHQRRSDIG